MARVCVHLVESEGGDYARSFSGTGTEYSLVCLACRGAPEAVEASLRDVSPERFSQIEEDGHWEWDRDAIHGRPGILVRPTNLAFRHEEITPDAMAAGTVSDLKPISSSRSGECIALLESGDLFLIDPVRGSSSRLMNAFETGITLEPRWSLHVSPRGEMAAVVEARGRHGVVLDLEEGRPTMTLDRGDYHAEQTDFPLAFFESDGQLRLVHGTDWNRLDVSDPRVGRTITDRTPTSYKAGEQQPEHYLDYFHGGLVVSPGGDRLADNGWVWHPVGVVTGWNLRRWVLANPWESEDGPSKRDICARSYFWNGPLCWIDDRTLAVWGYGNDDEDLIPAALIYDAEAGQLLRWFAGPVGTFVFDRYLFSSSAESGTTAWDVATGERVMDDASFCPTCYHPGARAFITVTPGGGLRLTRLVGGERGSRD